LLAPLWSLIGAFENQCCQFADEVELLASFERHEELIARTYDQPIVSESANFLIAMAQSRPFKEDREPQLFA
jgi:hypothetical protein